VAPPAPDDQSADEHGNGDDNGNGNADDEGHGSGHDKSGGPKHAGD
jgi:hypothetical protein